jgi:hypothetical protein
MVKIPLSLSVSRLGSFLVINLKMANLREMLKYKKLTMQSDKFAMNYTHCHSQIIYDSAIFLCHQFASVEPVIFMVGPNTAGARPTVASFPIVKARPDARPLFCIPNSRETVRQSFSLSLNKRADQHPDV